YHPSPAVVVRALELFERSGRDDFLAIARRLLAHGDHEVRAAVLRAQTRARPNRDTLEQARASTTAPVAATALVELAAHGWLEPQAALEQLERLVEREPAVGRYIALAADGRPWPQLVPLLIRLIDAEDLDTRRQTVRALAAMAAPQAIPALIQHLSDREVREEVRDTLVAMGEDAFRALERALADFSLPECVRVHVPRTIAGFRNQRAANLLLRHLCSEPRGMVRYKILRGLGRLVTDDPRLQLDNQRLDESIDRYLVHLLSFLHWTVTLERGAAADPQRHSTGHELLLDLIRAKYVLALERLFRLIGLRYRGENVAQIYRGLISEDPTLRSTSRELLESLLPARIRDATVALIDDLPEEARLAAGESHYQPEPLEYEELVQRLTKGSSRSVSYLASYHAAEIGLAGAGALPVLSRDVLSGLPRPARRRPPATAALEPALKGAA
ncbi:MAG TPA: HEAT repeat domain-containing protein, partial [Terriglobales bacterium]|nr:HEAT repeat domain-containing protein [Terriglobales bacterium]